MLHKRSHATSRGLSHCADSIAKRAGGLTEERRRNLQLRKIEDTKLAARNWNSRGLEERAKYAEIQNDSCLLSPDTIFGPYFVDGRSLFGCLPVLPINPFFYRRVVSP